MTVIKVWCLIETKILWEIVEFLLQFSTRTVNWSFQLHFDYSKHLSETIACKDGNYLIVLGRIAKYFFWYVIALIFFENILIRNDIKSQFWTKCTFWDSFLTKENFKELNNLLLCLSLKIFIFIPKFNKINVIPERGKFDFLNILTTILFLLFKSLQIMIQFWKKAGTYFSLSILKSVNNTTKIFSNDKLISLKQRPFVPLKFS